MKRFDEEDWIGVLAIALVLITTIGMSICAYAEHARCVDNGGHFERRNCHAYEDWVTDGDGNGSFESGTTCDHVCIGASAEDGR